MISTLTKLIQELSKTDPKTLSQKALKVAEEVGELAKVVLPFDNAAQTTHRFVDKQRILEEVADIYLTSISIAYQLDFTDDEIEEMIQRKTMKWVELQQRDLKVAGKKIPFELHVTVKSADRTEFIQNCKHLEVKPIILALQPESGTIIDVMTSSVHFGNNRSALDELLRIVQGLEAFGYEVVRKKIETVPWHPAAPARSHAAPIMPPNCYFETHLNVVVEHNEDKLRLIVSKFDAHLSRNTFKIIDGDTYTQMVTFRKYSGVYEDFDQEAQKLQDAIVGGGFQVEKRVTEFSIYDTKVSHDVEWLKNV